MKYVVEIAESLVRHIVVEAENEIDAKEKAWDAYNDEEIILDYRDYCDTEIDCLREADEHDVEDYEEI